jgi:aspartate-semialdehyde dehydrogenase
MSVSGVVVAVVGAKGVVGRELVDVLGERQFPLAECRRIDRANPIEQEDSDSDGDMLDVEEADFDGVDLVFMCASAAVTKTLASSALQAGARIIDLTEAYADDPSVPMVVPEVNAHVLTDNHDLEIVGSPTSGAVGLTVVLRPLEEVATLQRVVVAGYVSVSHAGRAGIDELSTQTVDLLNGRSVETGIFPQRVAFNVIPILGSAFADGVASDDRKIEQQTRQILELPELPIIVTSVIVPAFFGVGFVVNIQTESPLSAVEAQQVLRQAPGILLVDEPLSGACPTFADAVGQEATLVGRVRDDGSVAHGVSLWITLDSVRKGAAVNAVQIAELLMRHQA